MKNLCHVLNGGIVALLLLGGVQAQAGDEKCLSSEEEAASSKLEIYEASEGVIRGSLILNSCSGQLACQVLSPLGLTVLAQTDPLVEGYMVLRSGGQTLRKPIGSVEEAQIVARNTLVLVKSKLSNLLLKKLGPGEAHKVAQLRRLAEYRYSSAVDEDVLGCATETYSFVYRAPFPEAKGPRR